MSSLDIFTATNGLGNGLPFGIGGRIVDCWGCTVFGILTSFWVILLLHLTLFVYFFLSESSLFLSARYFCLRIRWGFSLFFFHLLSLKNTRLKFLASICLLILKYNILKVKSHLLNNCSFYQILIQYYLSSYIILRPGSLTLWPTLTTYLLCLVKLEMMAEHC